MMKAAYAEISLLKQLSSGSVASFDLLYKKYYSAVYANVFKIVRQAESTEDIIQEVFLSLWENRHNIQTDKPIGGWLFVVSYNKSVSFLKKKLKESIISIQHLKAVEWVADENSINDEQLFTTQLTLIENAFNRLPKRKREVFRLCRYEGRSYEEVAGLLGVSVNSVKDYLKQSTKLIRTDIYSKNAANSSGTLGLLMLYLGCQ